MMESSSLPASIKVTLEHVGNLHCGIEFLMDVVDSADGQSFYECSDGQAGECFQVGNGAGGWTWTIYLVVPHGSCANTYQMPRVPSANSPIGNYSAYDWTAKVEDISNEA